MLELQKHCPPVRKKVFLHEWSEPGKVEGGTENAMDKETKHLLPERKWIGPNYSKGEAILSTTNVIETEHPRSNYLQPLQSMSRLETLQGIRKNLKLRAYYLRPSRNNTTAASGQRVRLSCGLLNCYRLPKGSVTPHCTIVQHYWHLNYRLKCTSP